METLTTDTALVESMLWIPGALLYLPVGILAAVVLLEIVDGVQKTRENDRAALVLLIFGLVSTFFAAHLGAVFVFFLGDWGNFPFRRLLPGYALGLLFLASWLVKYLSRRSWRRAIEAAAGHRQTKQRISGNPVLNVGYRGLLAITAVAAAACLSHKADFGSTPAYVTLGYHGKASEMPKPKSEVAAEAPETAPAPEPEPAPEPAMKEPEPEPEPAPTSEPQPQPMPKLAEAPVEPLPEGLTLSFAKDVEPILEKYCYDCHGAEEDKGGVRLHTPAAIRDGDGDDPVVVPGKPKESPLYYLTTLPEGDDDVMPSKGDRLTKAETEVLLAWITEGAYLADNRKADDPPGGVVAEGDEGEEKGMPLSKQVVIPNPEYLATLTRKGIVITESAEKHMLELDYTKARLGPGEVDLTLLFPLARNVVSLDLSKSKVSDNETAALEEFENLVTLRLDRTNTGDDTLYKLSGLSKLESVSLFATRVTDSGINQLGSLANLKEVVLFNTLVTPNGANRLRERLPNAEIKAPE